MLRCGWVVGVWTILPFGNCIPVGFEVGDVDTQGGLHRDDQISSGHESDRSGDQQTPVSPSAETRYIEESYDRHVEQLLIKESVRVSQHTLRVRSSVHSRTE